MSDQVIDHANTLTVDEDVGPEIMDRVKRVQAELNEEQSGAVNIRKVDSLGEAIGSQPQVAKQEPVASDDEGQFREINSDAFNGFLQNQGITEDQLKEALLENHKFNFTFKGKEREFNHHELKSMLGRAESSQEQIANIQKSDEMKLGTLMKAASDGNKSAQKKVQLMLKTATGSEDFDDITDKLDEVADDFDENEALALSLEASAKEAVFADIKDDVDFETNMAKIDDDLRPRVPDSVFRAYWDNPHERRAMYDLVTSGRMESLLDAMDTELLKLSPRERVQIKGDPEVYGEMFVEVIHQENSKLTGDNQEAEGGPDPMDSVSSGARGRSQPVNEDESRDFLAMSSAEFAEWKLKNIPKI